MMNLPLPSLSDRSDNADDIKRYLFRLVETLNNTSIPTGDSSGTGISESVISELKTLVVRNMKKAETEWKEIRDTYVPQTTFDSHVTASDQRMTLDEQSITAVEQSITAVEQRMDTAEGKIETSEDRIGDIELWSAGIDEWKQIITQWKQNVTDYVIEDTTDDNGWSWRKWETGRAEAWYNSGMIGEVELTLVDDGVYSDSSIDGVELDLPEGLFDEAPTFCSINVTADTHAISQISDATNTGITYRIWRSYEGTGTMTINNIQIYCTGTWSEPEE